MYVCVFVHTGVLEMEVTIYVATAVNMIHIHSYVRNYTNFIVCVYCFQLQHFIGGSYKIINSDTHKVVSLQCYFM